MLSLNPDKTRLIEFGCHAAANRKKRGVGKPETFAFLGFTFICGKSRKGRFQLQRRARGDRMRANLKDIKAELRQRMHWPIPGQGKWLGQLLRGHFGYFAFQRISGRLSRFGIAWSTSGGDRYNGAARKAAQRGNGSQN